MGLFIGLGKFVSWNSGKWLAFEFPYWPAVIAELLSWLQISPYFAGAFWLKEQLDAGKATKRRVALFGTVVAPVMIGLIVYQIIFYTDGLSIKAGVASLLIATVWTAVALHISRRFGSTPEKTLDERAQE